MSIEILAAAALASQLTTGDIKAIDRFSAEQSGVNFDLLAVEFNKQHSIELDWIGTK